MSVFEIPGAQVPRAEELAALRGALTPPERPEDPQSGLCAYLVEQNRGTPPPAVLFLLFRVILGSVGPFSPTDIESLYKTANLPSVERYARRRLYLGQWATWKDTKPGCHLEWLAVLLDTGFEKRGSRLSRVFQPRLTPAATAILFHGRERFGSADEAAVAAWDRLLDWRGWLAPSFNLYESIATMEAIVGSVRFSVGTSWRQPMSLG